MVWRQQSRTQYPAGPAHTHPVPSRPCPTDPVPPCSTKYSKATPSTQEVLPTQDPPSTARYHPHWPLAAPVKPASRSMRPYSSMLCRSYRRWAMWAANSSLGGACRGGGGHGGGGGSTVSTPFFEGVGLGCVCLVVSVASGVVEVLPSQRPTHERPTHQPAHHPRGSLAHPGAAARTPSEPLTPHLHLPRQPSAKHRRPLRGSSSSTSTRHPLTTTTPRPHAPHHHPIPLPHPHPHSPTPPHLRQAVVGEEQAAPRPQHLQQAGEERRLVVDVEGGVPGVDRIEGGGGEGWGGSRAGAAAAAAWGGTFWSWLVILY